MWGAMSASAQMESEQHVHAAAAAQQARAPRPLAAAQRVERDRHDLLPEVGLEPAALAAFDGHEWTTARLSGSYENYSMPMPILFDTKVCSIRSNEYVYISR